MKKSTNKLIRIAIYIRVSSDEQAKNGDSIRDQKEACLNYISAHQDTALQDVYVDDGVSGQKLNRDDFSRLMANIHDDKIDMIIFTKLDRWFRSLRHYLNTQAILEKKDVSWLAINQPYFDTSTPYGRAFVAQSMTWAELEAQNGGIRVKDVFKSKVEHGEVITGKTPRGYCISNKHLEMTEEAPIVAQAFQVTWDTQSMGAGHRFLVENGIIMGYNNFKQSILCNEKYTGRYRDNPNYCPRIISDELYQNIQIMVQERKNVKSDQRYHYIFSGLLTCGDCGDKLGGCHINVVSRRKSGKVYRYRYPAYLCVRQKGKRHGKSCSNGGEIREFKIEEYLLSCIREEIEQYIANYRTKEAPIIDNRTKKQAIQRKLDKLKILYINDLITLDDYKTDHDAFVEQLDALPDIIVADMANVNQLSKLLESNFESIYCSFDNNEKRIFWRSILKYIYVNKRVNGHREYQLIFL